MIREKNWPVEGEQGLGPGPYMWMPSASCSWASLPPVIGNTLWSFSWCPEGLRECTQHMDCPSQTSPTSYTLVLLTPHIPISRSWTIFTKLPSYSSRNFISFPDPDKWLGQFVIACAVKSCSSGVCEPWVRCHKDVKWALLPKGVQRIRSCCSYWIEAESRCYPTLLPPWFPALPISANRNITVELKLDLGLSIFLWLSWSPSLSPSWLIRTCLSLP